MNEQKTYAPIIIPTCCRDQHLKRCLDSLSKSPIAKQTDLFISVDYPPRSDMEDGYKRVREYLNTSEVCGFKSINVIYQENNLGFYDNIDFLTDWVKSKGYQTFIYSEDDLEFSPCFLEYVNKGLELFKNDPRIFSICGYKLSSKNVNSENNVGEFYAFLQWGYGAWIDKYYRVIEQVNKKSFESLLRDSLRMKHLACNRGDEFRFLFEATATEPGKLAGIYNRYYSKSGKIAHIDQTIGPIMCLEKMFSIHPYINMVRNTGFDDHSGHTIISNNHFEYSKEEITSDTSFEYVLKNDFMSQEDISSAPSNKITYLPAKRAWFLRRIYLLGMKRTVRAIMWISYYIGRLMAYIMKTDEPSYSWNM